MIQHATDAVDNREPQTKAFFVPALLKTTEFLEDVSKLVFRNTRPGIPYLNADIPFQTPTAQQDFPTWGVTNGVGKKILDNAPQQF